MPKKVKMPKLKLVPLDRTATSARRLHFGWFVRGFVAAALVFGAYLAFTGFVGTARTSEAGKTIIEGQ